MLNIYILLLFILTGHAAAQDEGFISLDHDCKQPAVASAGTNLYLVWMDNRDEKYKVYFKSSFDEGKTWSSDKILSKSETAECYPPAITADSDSIHVAWVDYGDSIDGKLCYIRSSDRGNKWDGEKIIVEDANSTRYPVLKTDGSAVFMFWQDVQNRIFFKPSYDKGNTWEKEIFLGKLEMHSCYCYPPAACVIKNRIIVAYADLKKDDSMAILACRISDDRGRTWQKQKVIAETKIDPEIEGEISNPVFADDGQSALFLFWIDKRDFRLGEMYGVMSRDGGNMWSREIRLLKSKKSPKRPSALMEKNGNAYIVWANFFGGKSDVCFTCSKEDGIKWEKSRVLSQDRARYHDPIIAGTAQGTVHVFWFDETDKWSRIFYRRSRDNGKTWE